MATADFSPSLSAATVSEGAALQNRLDLLARRRNVQRMLRALVRAAIPGVAISALAVLLYKLHIIPDGPLWAPAAIIAVFLLWGFRTGRLQRVNSFEAACDADQNLDLDDRLSSALAFVAPAKIQRQVKVAAPSGLLPRLRAAVSPHFTTHQAVTVPPTNLVPALVGEASTRAQKLDPRRVYPFAFDRPAQVLAALALLFVGLCFMPDYAIFQSAQEKKQVEAMQNAGEKLIVVAKTIQKTQAPKAEEVQRLSHQLEKLGQKMIRGRMTKRAALTEMGQLRQKIEKAQQNNSQSQSAGMPQIAEAIREAPLQSETGRKVQQQLAQNKWDEAAKSLEQLADKVDKGQLSETEKQKTADDLKKIAQDLRSRGGDANKKAADQLEAAANQLQQKSGQQQPNQSQQQSGQNGQQPNQNPPGQNQQGQQQQGQNPQNKQNGGQKQQSQNGQGQQKQPSQNGQSQMPGIPNSHGLRQGQPKSGNQQGGQQQQQGGQQPGGQQNQGQQGGNQQQSQGSQQGQGAQSGSNPQRGQSGNQGASDALRNMANGLRGGGSGGSNSQNLRDMMSKLREAENQTGSNGGQQYGMGKPGQGGGPSFGQGQGVPQNVTPGKDLMPSDPHGQVSGGAGLGPRNNAQGVQKGGGVSNQKSQRTGDKRHYEDVWSDRLPKTHKQIDRIQGKWGGNGEIDQLPTRGEAKGGQVKTPYYDVYESYKRDEEQAVSRDSVPPAYKQPVKDYFESIKP